MKAQHIIAQLLTNLPKKTSLFSNSVPISSLSYSGGIVTAVTSSAHGLKTGKNVTISGALSRTVISSLTFSGGTVTAITATSHDLTESWADGTVTIEGADQTEYNGTFILKEVKNRTTFTYDIAGTPASPATGTIYLLEDRLESYNGRFPVTVTDATTFTYPVARTLSATAGGTPLANVGVRVSGAISVERAEESYTEQSANELWAFVVLGDTTISRERSILSDANLHLTGTEEMRVREIESFSIFVFSPAGDSIAARQARDQIEDVAIAFYSALYGFKISSPFNDGRPAVVTPNGHNFLAYQKSYYIHQFNFQTIQDIVREDGVSPADNVAFRNMQITFKNDFDQAILQTDIDFDEVPL